MIKFFIKLFYFIRTRMRALIDRKDIEFESQAHSSLDIPYEFAVVLTQYKRRNLKSQLEAVARQTKAPSAIFVVQNGAFVDISKERDKFKFHHIHNHFNTKYFGRFAFCLSISAKNLIVMDDDIIPGDRSLLRALSTGTGEARWSDWWQWTNSSFE